jgi:uncharacterized protein (TIGR02246 family)
MDSPTFDLQDFDLLPQSDQDAVFTTLFNLLSGFRERDADQLNDVYSDDADWVNAFGTTQHGGRDIVAYLRGLFADDNFNAGELAAPPASRIRRLTDDVVIVSTHLQVAGQLLVDGSAIELRDNHSLRILARQPNGSWRVESEMYMDARTDETYAHAS